MSRQVGEGGHAAIRVNNHAFGTGAQAFPTLQLFGPSPIN